MSTKLRHTVSEFLEIVRSVVFWSVCALIIFVSFYIIKIMVIFFHIEEIFAVHRARRIWAKLSLRFSGVKIRVEGLSHLKSHKSYLLASNHQGYLDGLLLSSIIPQYFRFLLWNKIFKIPIFGPLVRRSGCIPISDNNYKEALESILKVTELTKSGELFVIFPEGRLTRDGKLGAFGRGCAVIALNSKIPVIPIAIKGSFEVLSRGQWILRPGMIKLKIGEPIIFDNYKIIDKIAYTEATEKIRKSIERLMSQM